MCKFFCFTKDSAFKLLNNLLRGIVSSSCSEEKREAQTREGASLWHRFFLKSNIFFKGFIEFVIILLLLYVLVFWPPRHVGYYLPDQELKLRPMHWKVKS